MSGAGLFATAVVVAPIAAAVLSLLVYGAIVEVAARRRGEGRPSSGRRPKPVRVEPRPPEAWAVDSREAGVRENVETARDAGTR